MRGPIRRALLLITPVAALACSSEGADATSAGGAGGEGGGLEVAGGAGGEVSSGSGGGGGSTSGGGGAGGDSTSAGEGGGGGGSTSSASGGGPCPAGVTCVEDFPFSDPRDTSADGVMAIPSYACAPDTNEGGPEILYRLWLPSDGFVSATVRDGDGVDVDVQILTDLDPAAPSGASCVARGDVQAAADLPAGEAWIVADTWVNGSGTALPGAFTIDIGFVAPSEGSCGMLAGSMDRVGDDAPLAMPATGPVTREGHLVTAAEPAPYPTSSSEELAEHHALSQDATGLVMLRSASWAPADGASYHGASLVDPADLPVVDEAWYLTMAWSPAARPPPGTRMIVRHPDDPSRAVVVAAGYDTGPASLADVAGTSEETLFYLGTEGGAPLTVGLLADQTLPLGPRRCTD
jgi:hypothetical protein